MSRKVRLSLISLSLGKCGALKESGLSSTIIDPAGVVLFAPPPTPHPNTVSPLKRGYLPSGLCGHAPWDLHSPHNPHFQHLISLDLSFLLDVLAERHVHAQTHKHT